MAIYRPNHEGFIKFGVEAAALAHDATTLGSAPSLGYVGYGDIPNITINEGSQIVDAVGTPYGVDEVYGDRDVQFVVSLKLGNTSFLQYLFRDSGVSGANAYGLPILALAGGTSNNYAGKGFTWLCRYCLCNSFTVRFQEGSAQPVMLEANFLTLAVDEAGSLQTTSAGDLITAGGEVLTWAHSDIVWNSTSYRSHIGGATITVNNNVKPEGRRKDYGVTNPLSRTPYELIPHDNKITSQLTLKDKLPSGLRGQFNGIAFSADNTPSGATSPKSVTITLGSSLISSTSLKQGAVGTPMAFDGSYINRGLTITSSGS